jgi:hypothetical protein
LLSRRILRQKGWYIAPIAMEGEAAVTIREGGKTAGVLVSITE